MTNARRSARKRLAAALAICAACVFGPDEAVSCGVDTDCMVAGGDYRIWIPDGATSAHPVGAIVFLHGYGSSSSDMVGFDDLRRTAATLGVALIAPDGVDGRWNVPGLGRTGRDEIAFVDAAVSDAVARFPIDRDRVVISGFSLGASIVWYMACAEGRDYAAYVPIAGTFWEPYVETCAMPPPELRQVHGTADQTFPLSGRQLSFARQGDTLKSFALLAEFAGCAPDFGPAEKDGELSCSRRTCAGATQELCLHSGGHGVSPAWIGQEWRKIAAERGWD